MSRLNRKIKLEYCCSDIPDRSYLTMIPKNSTVKQVLEAISKKQKNKYVALFFDGSQIDDEKLIEDYYEEDRIFEASPTYDYYSVSKFELEFMHARNPAQESKKSENHLSRISQSKTWPPFKFQFVNNQTITPPEIESKDTEIKFIFYFTGSTNDHLLMGIPVILKKSMDLHQCRNELIKSLHEENVNIDDKQLLIYLPGGIPFISGTLDDIFSNSKNDLKYCIYGVLTRQISDELLNKYYDNLCDSSNSDRQLLISPFYDSSERGLSDMACLLGYLNNNGQKKDLILKVLAEITDFAPLIISLYKICRKEKIKGIDIVTVCSTLFSYLRNIFPKDKCNNNEVFEYAIYFLDTISDLPSYQDSLPITQIDFDKEKLITDKFIRDENVYIWGNDFMNKFSFNLYQLNQIDFDKMKNESKNYTSSILIEADSILSVPEKAIIKGENHEYFYLMKSSSSDPKSKNNVVVIDPMTGNFEIKNADCFMKNKNNTKSDDVIREVSSTEVEDKESKNFFIDETEENEFHDVKGQIGEGATSITYKVIDKRTNTPMCKKVLKYKKGQTSIKDAQRAMNEFQILYNISHPCICRAIGINLSEILAIKNKKGQNEEITTIALFLEYLEYGLGEILKTNINNTFKVRIVLDIVHAMNFLHKNGMIHRDLKIENIMLNEFFEVKLVDFGVIKITESVLNEYEYVEESLTKGVGTFSYMSPEMINEEDYDNKTDVYSFGVVLHFIFTGELPKQSMKDKLNGKSITLPSPSSLISSFCIELISKCLETSPSKRPSFEEILDLLRQNSYVLLDDINPSILKKRDEELTLIESKMPIKLTF